MTRYYRGIGILALASIASIPSDAGELRYVIEECVGSQGLQSFTNTERCLIYSVIEALRSDRPVILVTGSRGSGKTFTLSTLATLYKRRLNVGEVIWANAEYKQSLINAKQMLGGMRGSTILVIDDVGEIRDDNAKKAFTELLSEALKKREAMLLTKQERSERNNIYVMLGVQMESFTVAYEHIRIALKDYFSKYFGERCDLKRRSEEFSRSVIMHCERALIINLDVFWKELIEANLKPSISVDGRRDTACNVFDALADMASFIERCMHRGTNIDKTERHTMSLSNMLRGIASELSKAEIYKIVSQAFNILAKEQDYSSLRLYEERVASWGADTTSVRRIKILESRVNGRLVGDLLARLYTMNIDSQNMSPKLKLLNAIIHIDNLEPLRSFIASALVLSKLMETKVSYVASERLKLRLARSFASFIRSFFNDIESDIIFERVERIDKRRLQSKRGLEVIKLNIAGKTVLVRALSADEERTIENAIKRISGLIVVKADKIPKGEFLVERANAAGVVYVRIPESIAALISAFGEFAAIGNNEFIINSLRQLLVVRALRSYLTRALTKAASQLASSGQSARRPS